MIHRAIIPAAGYGVRNLPITKVIPKEMFPIVGRPTIAFIVEEAIAAGIQEILIILSRNKNEIMNYFDRSIELEWFLASRHKEHLIRSITPPKINIYYIRQQEALGLGHAVLLGEAFAGNEPFAVLLPDQVSLQRKSMLLPLLRIYESTSSSVVGLQKVAPELLSNYGVVAAQHVKGRQYTVQSIVEKPQQHPPSDLALMGRYVLEPDIFAYLKETKPGIGNEIQLTDALNVLSGAGRMSGYMYKERWYDTSLDEDYILIQQKAYQMNRKQPDRLS